MMTMEHKLAEKVGEIGGGRWERGTWEEGEGEGKEGAGGRWAVLCTDV